MDSRHIAAARNQGMIQSQNLVEDEDEDEEQKYLESIVVPPLKRRVITEPPIHFDDDDRGVTCYEDPLLFIEETVFKRA